jgi:hypothetical protein
VCVVRAWQRAALCRAARGLVCLLGLAVRFPLLRVVPVLAFLFLCPVVHHPFVGVFVVSDCVSPLGLTLLLPVCRVLAVGVFPRFVSLGCIPLCLEWGVRGVPFLWAIGFL